MTDPVEHHRAVKYRVQDFAQLTTGFQITPLTDGQRIQIVGTCPGCGGRTEVIWAYGNANNYKGLFPRRKGERKLSGGPRTVCCDCGHGHLDRPADAIFFGCGAYWQVELPA